MLKFKCRIDCTSVEQLNFNGSDVDTPANYNNFLGLLQQENIAYIKGIQIVCRKRIDINYTLKSLEFFISKELEEHQFADFVRIMKDCGFRSNSRNNRIQFLEFLDNGSTTPMKLLYDYNFRTEKPNSLTGLQAKANRYRYNTKVIYKK
jgi:hypothetical protein